MARASLSVITCNYNHGHYLDNALGAILAQSRLPDEVIVIDDGSTDASRDVIESFARHGIVKPVYHDCNKGGLARANEAAAMARGDYIYFAAADDCVLPGCFEKLMALAEQYPDAGLVFSDLLSFLQDDVDHMRFPPQPLGTTVRRLTPEEVIDAQRKHRFSIPGAAAILKRTALHEAGMFPVDLRWHSDWFINMVIAFRYGFAYLPGGFSAQRWQPDSYFNAGAVIWNNEREALRALVRHLESTSYRDVRQAFVESGVLSHFGEQWLRLVFTEPAAIKLLTPRVLRHCIYRAVRDPLKKILPHRVIGMINRLRSSVGFGAHRNL